MASCFLVSIKLPPFYFVATIDYPSLTSMVAHKDPKLNSEVPDPDPSSDEDEERRQELIEENQFLREGTNVVILYKVLPFAKTCFTHYTINDKEFLNGKIH